MHNLVSETVGGARGSTAAPVKGTQLSPPACQGARLGAQSGGAIPALACKKGTHCTWPVAQQPVVEAFIAGCSVAAATAEKSGAIGFGSCALFESAVPGAGTAACVKTCIASSPASTMATRQTLSSHPGAAGARLLTTARSYRHDRTGLKSKPGRRTPQRPPTPTDDDRVGVKMDFFARGTGSTRPSSSVSRSGHLLCASTRPSRLRRRRARFKWCARRRGSRLTRAGDGVR